MQFSGGLNGSDLEGLLQLLLDALEEMGPVGGDYAESIEFGDKLDSSGVGLKVDRFGLVNDDAQLIEVLDGQIDLL